MKKYLYILTFSLATTILNVNAQNFDDNQEEPTFERCLESARESLTNSGVTNEKFIYNYASKFFDEYTKARKVYDGYRQSFRDDLDENKLNWDEFSNRRGYVMFNNGVLQIDNKDKKSELSAYARIPINKDEDFIFSTAISSAKVDNIIGVIFNYEDDGDYSILRITENHYTILNYKGGELSKQPLGSGKIRQNVFLLRNPKIITIEKKGINLILRINSVECQRLRIAYLKSDIFGFMVLGKGTMNIDWISVHEPR